MGGGVFFLLQHGGCSPGPVQSVTDENRDKGQRQVSPVLKYSPPLLFPDVDSLPLRHTLLLVSMT